MSPSWDYKCVGNDLFHRPSNAGCGHVFTLTFATTLERDAYEDGRPLNCPQCRRPCSCERQIGNTNFSLKGSGWPSKDMRK